MKTQWKIGALVFLSLALVVMGACKGGKKKEHASSSSTSTATDTTPATETVTATQTTGTYVAPTN